MSKSRHNHAMTFCYMYFVLQVLVMNKKIDPVELDFLLRFPAVPNVTSPVDFLSNNSWGGIKALSAMDQFRNLDRDIEVNYYYSNACFFTIYQKAPHLAF